MSEQSIELTSIVSGDCDHELIHIPGSILPHGVLLTFDPNDLRVVHAGGDTIGLLGKLPFALLGATAAEIFSSEAQLVLQRLLASGRSLLRPVHVFFIGVESGCPADVLAHLSDGLLILDLEPRSAPQLEDAIGLITQMGRNVQQAGSLQELLEVSANEIHKAIGFDRVMVYRFAPDGSGEVVAEVTNSGVPSFLGLHYPATDIPLQARALYLANWIRHIPDARYAPAPIIPPLDPTTGRPVDLSQSGLRSVSPVHRQYLANMGVVASMSLSLVHRGRLWGLIAGHHFTPRYLPRDLRNVCELFAYMASSQLEVKLSERDPVERFYQTLVHEELVTQVSREADLAEGLSRCRPGLMDLVSAGGVGLWIGGRFSSIGATPQPEQVKALVAWLGATTKVGVFQTASLPVIYPPARDFADFASGLLVLSVSNSHNDFVMWFRPEIIRTVTWAGNPDKSAQTRFDSETLTPRSSFAAWQESVRWHASPWLEREIDAAHRLRLSLLEVVLRRIEQTAMERAAAQAQQAKLLKELDLRLEEWQATAQALRLETERRATLEAELSGVLRRTVADQEAERERIARELHDTLGQSLTLLQLGLEAIGRSDSGGEEFKDRLASLKRLTIDLGHDLNRLAWEVRPTALADLGIQTAIRNLLETWSERSNVQFDLHLALDHQRLSPDVETTLYRVLQEALTNVVRHADATRVGVVLQGSDQVVTLIIEDDGRGFDADNGANLSAKRLGLLGIRERLALVGGQIEIESKIGKGASLFIRIPL
jgi:light-regulated signal transduction histidine kinase (bacteriophytochrome)